MTDPKSLVLFLVLSQRTAFMKFQDMFPECYFYREHSPRADPLICLTDDHSCSVGKNCMDILCKRLKIMFDNFLPNVDLILLYYKRGDEGIGAGVFWRDFREPRTITVNPSGWNRIKQRSKLFEFSPEPGFFLGAQPPTKKQDESFSLAK